VTGGRVALAFGSSHVISCALIAGESSQVMSFALIAIT